MAFESLTDKLQNVFKKLRGKGRLTEEDVKVALKEVKMALLEADVNFKVVKQFTKTVHNVLSYRTFLNRLRKLLNNLEVDIRFQKSHLYFF